MFISALFMIAKHQNQPTCPSTDEGIMKLEYVNELMTFSSKEKCNQKIFREIDILRMYNIKGGYAITEENLHFLPICRT